MNTAGRLSLLAALLTLTSMLAATGVAIAQEANEPGDDATPRFLYTRYQWGIYLDEDGDVRRVGYAHGHYVAPRFIPGSDKILFHSKRQGPLGIWLQDLNDIDARERVCTGHQAAVSPEGERIAFVRDGELILRFLATGAERVAARGKPGELAWPGFLCDGRLMYVIRGEPKDRLMILPSLNLDKEPIELLQAEIASAPRASDDCSYIAYPDGAHLYLYNLVQRTTEPLTFAGGVQSWPMWSKDNKSVSYLQSNTPHDGPWRVHNVALDSRGEVRQLLTDVMHAPDWNGVMPEDPFAFETKAAGLEAVPGDGGEVWETPWGVLFVNRPKHLIAFVPTGGRRQVVLAFTDAEGRPVTDIAGVSSTRHGDSLEVTVDLKTPDGQPARATLTLPTWRPMVTVTPGKGLDGFVVRRPMAWVVVPDRLGDDVILEGGESESDRPLPPAPMTVGLLEPQNYMLTLVTPDPEQRTTLTAAGDLHVTTAGSPATVGVTTGDMLWREPKAEPAKAKGQVSIEWANELAGQWRVAMRRDDDFASRFRIMKTPSKPKEWIVDAAVTNPSTAVTYLFGRRHNTPLDVVTPLDIVRDALGLERADEALDTAGVRRFRHAEQRVPFKHPEVSLAVVGWMNTPDRPGVKEKMAVVFGDLVTSLESLEVRAADYAKHLKAFRERIAEMKKAARQADDNNLVVFLDEVDKQADLLAKNVAEMHGDLTPMTRIKEKTSEFATNPPGKWRNENKPEFKELSKLALTIRDERLDIVTAYRAFFKAMRDRAALELAEGDHHRAPLVSVRRLAGDALRRRYFLEGDWRGEDYLSDHYEVPLENITRQGLQRGRGR